MSIKGRLPRERGVTMIELIVFILIVSIGVAGILGVMTYTTGKSADPVRSKQALILAEGLLEEVERANFSYCDPTDPNAAVAASSAACTIPEAWGQSSPEPTANGRPLDNVNDYVTASGTATRAFDVNGVLSDANGTALNLAGYTASVSIAPAAIGPSGSLVGVASPTGGVSTGSTADNELLRITVRIDYDNQSLILDGYRARYAPNSL